MPRFLLCLVLTLGLSSCALLRGTPESEDPMVKIVAWSTVENGRASPLSAAQEAPLMNRLGEHTFNSVVTAKYPPSASGEAQKIALARAAARREALRRFSNQVLEFGPPQKSILVQFFGPQQSWIDDFAQYLEAGVRLQYENKPNGVTAMVSVPGDDLFAWFIENEGKAGDPESGLAAAPAADLPARRTDAENRATALAREGLIKRLCDIAESSRRFSFLRPRDRALEAAIRARVEAQAPDRIVFADDGRCVAIISFAREELKSLQGHDLQNPTASGTESL